MVTVIVVCQDFFNPDEMNRHGKSMNCPIADVLSWFSGNGRRHSSEGRGFKSQHCVLYGHFFTYICCGIVMFVWKDENKRKRGGGWPFIKNWLSRLMCAPFSKPQSNCRNLKLKSSSSPTAWPEIEVKSSPNFPRVAQKVDTSVSTWKVMSFKKL